MEVHGSAVTYLSPAVPVNMGDWWFEVANGDHFWIRSRFRVMCQMADAALRSCTHAAEIGCGNGLVQRQIEDAYDKPVTGFDLNEVALQKNVSRISPLYCYDIKQRKIDFRNCFDLLLMFDVLEHIEDENEFLQSVKFHLRSSAVLLVNVPAHQWLYSDYDRAAGHVRRYSIDQLTNLAAQNGFRVRAATYWGLPLLPLLLLRKYMKLGREDGKAGFDSRSPFLNLLLSRLARCEPVPHRLTGTSVMAVLERATLERE